MRRLLSAYRWELWLVIGFPVVASIVSMGAQMGIGSVMRPYDSYSLQTASFLLSTVTTAALLVLFYDRVRRQGRELLALLWGYSLWAAIAGMLTLGVQLLAHTTALATDRWEMFLRQTLVAGVGFLLSLGVLFWFTRQASRHSLMHMCFLVVWAVPALGLGAFHPTSVDSFLKVYIAQLVSCVVGLAAMLLHVWLLCNFDRRGPLFRRNAVLALVVAAFVSGYAGMLVFGLGGAVGGLYQSILLLLSLVGIGELQFAAIEFVYYLTSVVSLAISTVFELMALAVLLGLAYLLRVRPSLTTANGEHGH